MWRFLLFIFAIFLSVSAIAQQEICDNCIDDDGDGLIDCYDEDCSKQANFCNDFFITNYSKQTDSLCPLPALTSTNTFFELASTWLSTDKVTTTNTPVVGDVDGDGVPEVICIYEDGTAKIRIIDGITGITDISITNALAYGSPAIADVDKNGYAEIFVADINGLIYCYEYNPLNNSYDKKWVSSGSFQTNNNEEWWVGIADFDGDDTAEVYMGLTIFNALTGDFIAKNSDLSALTTVAADVLKYDGSTCIDCNGLELISGNNVYGVDIKNKTITKRKSAPSPVSGNIYSLPAVADINNDGVLDVVAKGGGYLFAWTPQSGTLLATPYTMPSGMNRSHGMGGLPLLGNFDLDDELEIGLVTETLYILFEHDLTIKWSITINEFSSGQCSSTSFDFDNDGIAEIVCRDMDSLFILNGNSGQKLSSALCKSETLGERPLVADINGDGHANILCPSGDYEGPLMVFESKFNEWSCTRKVMNQFSYSATNINDDLTVPCNQQNAANLGLYKMNAFLHQPSLMNEKGETVCPGLSDTCKAPVVVSDSISIPNVFSPNGDGLNDEFIVYTKGVIDYSITIYNRWGEKVFSNNNPAISWNGKINNSSQAAELGTYFYVINTISDLEKETETFKGTITISR